MADEDPIYSPTLTPGRLVMRLCACMYCSSNDYNDYILDYLYGIRACKQHAAWAVRDNKAFCHTMKMVSIDQEKRNPLFARLVELLNKELRIKRSNGLIEDGWTLVSKYSGEYPYIKKIGDVWTVPLANKTMQAKRVSFQDLATHNNYDADLTAYLNDLEQKLNDGIYLNEYNEVNAIGKPATLPVPSGMMSIAAQDGRTGLIYVGQ